MSFRGWCDRLFRLPSAQPLSFRILIATVTVSAVVATAATLLQFRVAYQSEMRVIEKRLDAIEESYLPSLAQSVWSMYTPQIKLILDGVLGLPDIAQVRVTASGLDPIQLGHPVDPPNQLRRTFALVHSDGETRHELGTLEVVASTEGLHSRLAQRALGIIIGEAVTIFIVGLLAYAMFQIWVNRYLREIASHARVLDVDTLASPFVLSRPRRNTPDEIDQVVEAMNRMRERLSADIEARSRAEAEVQWHRNRLEELVAERTSQLEARSAQLERQSLDLISARDRAEGALHTLKSAQEQLVRSEKLASLGQLVAGVAHEVNTPIGIALTAASYLHTQAGNMAVDLQANKLSKLTLTRFVDESVESCGLIERNVGRAAQLVRSFKQVSVDRTSDGRRTFHMNAFLNEIVDSLKLPWRHSPIRFEVFCAPDMTLDSFPGALGQVIFNLVQNAAIHGIGADNAGTITIDARPDGVDGLQIEVCDDGVGIADENFGKVFEPFFTTRRGEGGTGLGLHIVHNLVSHKLGGKIELRRGDWGKGCCFTIIIPCKAP